MFRVFPISMGSNTLPIASCMAVRLSTKNDEGTERVELHESQQRRERDRYNGADVGDEVQHENQKCPGLGEIYSDPAQAPRSTTPR